MSELTTTNMMRNVKSRGQSKSRDFGCAHVWPTSHTLRIVKGDRVELYGCDVAFCAENDCYNLITRSWEGVCGKPCKHTTISWSTWKKIRKTVEKTFNDALDAKGLSRGHFAKGDTKLNKLFGYDLELLFRCLQHELPDYSVDSMLQAWSDCGPTGRGWREALTTDKIGTLNLNYADLTDSKATTPTESLMGHKETCEEYLAAKCEELKELENQKLFEAALKDSDPEGWI